MRTRCKDHAATRVKSVNIHDVVAVFEIKLKHILENRMRDWDWGLNSPIN